MTRLEKLRLAWQHHNDEDFGGKLAEPMFSVGRRERLVEGAFTYNNDGRGKKLMIKGEMFKDQKLFLAVLLHEMIHQWELEVLHVDAEDNDHKGAFKEKAAELSEKYGVDVYGL